MAVNLMKIFSNNDLKDAGKTAMNVISLELKSNRKTGEQIARAVLDNGVTLIKNIGLSGAVTESITKLPEIITVDQRNDVIKDLASQKFNQETIAAMLDISQSTVSNVLKKNKN